LLNSLSGLKHVLAVFVAAIGLLNQALLYTFSVQRIPIGDCITLFSLTLVWTPILECILRHGCLGKGHVTSGVLGLVGILFFTRPSFSFPQQLVAASASSVPLGYLSAVLSGVCSALITNTFGFQPCIHWSVWFLAYACVGLLLTPVIFVVIHHGAPPSYAFSLQLLATMVIIVVLNIVAHIFRVCAIQTGTPTPYALASVVEGGFLDQWDGPRDECDQFIIGILSAHILRVAISFLRVATHKN
jgi:hypothetical protein